jgi:hypothetical protein
MFRKGIGFAVLVGSVAVAPLLGGCAWETGDEAVYYQHAPKHELDNGSINDPSGLGTTTNAAVAAQDPNAPAPVQAGVSPVGPPPPPKEPEPQPWMILPENRLPPGVGGNIQ